MSELASYDQKTLNELKESLKKRYEGFVAKGLNLDMTRGKPGSAQLDLSSSLLDLPGSKEPSAKGPDIRNYGVLEGLPEVRKLFADLMEIDSNEVIVGGNSSLTLMHDLVVQGLLHGTAPDYDPWFKKGIKFLCPVPGYDRHFAICEHFGIEMIPVPLTDNGPDMKVVESLVKEDPSIKGIWCVPKYSNPTGVVYTDETVDRLSSMKTAANDFRIFWDNAYIVHHLGDGPAPLKNILRACESSGNPDRAYLFVSTSKISMAGAGISAFASSQSNLKDVKSHLSKQTIGSDKVNQWRHFQFFKDQDGVLKHMDKHAALLAPKFEAIQKIFGNELDSLKIANWSQPKGGYFVSVETEEGCAVKVIEMAAAAGVKLTKAGATWPLGKDPKNSNIRLAPSLPPLSEVETAMEIVAVCIKLVTIEKHL